MRHFLAQSAAWQPTETPARRWKRSSAPCASREGYLRYGRLYGPGTYYASQPPSPPRIQVDEAACRTVAALDAASGVHAIVEDE